MDEQDHVQVSSNAGQEMALCGFRSQWRGVFLIKYGVRCILSDLRKAGIGSFARSDSGSKDGAVRCYIALLILHQHGYILRLFVSTQNCAAFV